MKKHLTHFYEKYLNGTLLSESHGIENYSRYELTNQLAGLLDNLNKKT
jgi:hypothetical protein